jgi:hypothetical protein
MDDQLWNLFRETGEPMSYLLYRAEKNRKKEADSQPPERRAGRDDPGAPELPTASA